MSFLSKNKGVYGTGGVCLSLGAQNIVQAHLKEGAQGFKWELNRFNWLKVQKQKALLSHWSKNQRQQIGESERNSLIHVGQSGGERNCRDWRGEEAGLPW